MKKKWLIALGVLLLLVPTGCKNTADIDPPVVGSTLDMTVYRCLDEESEIQWKLSFETTECTVYAYSSDGWVKYAHKRVPYTFYNSQVEFYATINIPADKSPDGQQKEYNFCNGQLENGHLFATLMTPASSGDGWDKRQLEFVRY